MEEVRMVLPAALVPETLTLVSLLGMMTERVTLVLLIPFLMSTWLPLPMQPPYLEGILALFQML